MDYILGFDSRYFDGNLPDGYDYVFYYAKATEHTSFVPENFETVWKTKLIKGAYHFWRHYADPIKQAQHFYDTVKATGDFGQLPPVLDCEDTGASPSMQMVAHIRKCLGKIEELFGVRPMVYTGAWWWDAFVGPYLGNSDFSDYELWVAHYNTVIAEPYLPEGFEDWSVWQYIGDWKAAGFNDKIDVNRAKKHWFYKYIAPNGASVREKLQLVAGKLIDLAEEVTGISNETN